MNPLQPDRRATLPNRRLIFVLAAFNAVSAITGGLWLIGRPRGDWQLPLELLRQTPFATFRLPGLILVLVVGGSSLVCAALVRRRSAAAIDAILLAGGVLTIWIVVQVALLRSLHWLHVLCGAVGLTLTALGARAAWSSSVPRHRWILLVTAGEATGFVAPALVGIFLASRLPAPWSVPLVVAAGAFEGAALGTAQARALPCPVRRSRYTVLTSLAAAGVWALAIGLVSLGHGDAAASVKWMAIALAAPVGLLAIGTAQWLELRHHSARSHGWIAWTALAWMIALPLSFTAGPLVDESTPPGAQIAIWSSAGVLMAYAMALITWQGVRRLHPTPGPVAEMISLAAARAG